MSVGFYMVVGLVVGFLIGSSYRDTLRNIAVFKKKHGRDPGVGDK